MGEETNGKAKEKKRSRLRWVAIGCGVLLFLSVCLGGLGLLLTNSEQADEATSPAGVADVGQAEEEAQETAEVEAAATTDEGAAQVPTEPPDPTDTPAPTDTPEPTDTPAPTATPTPLPEGLSRSNPFTNTIVVEVPNWNVEILDVVRGEEAWNMVRAANQFNDPAPEGMEYLLLNLRVQSAHDDEETHRIGGRDFKVTGDRFHCYGTASAVDPEPELDGEVSSGGEVTGWVSYLVGVEESNLMLVVDELLSFDEERFRYVALEPGASLTVDPALADIDPTEAGRTRQDPVPLNETATTEDWEVTVLEVIRGDEAWARIQGANQFNDRPPEGMEYLLARVGVRNISTVDEYRFVDEFAFNPTGTAYVLHDLPSVVTPGPVFDLCLYPGGYDEGWVSMAVYEDETDLMALFEPSFAFFDDDELRHLALEEGASLDVPQELAAIEPNALGESRSDPAPFGETVVTEDWEIRVEEVVRGDQAWTMAQEANQFNDPPQEGMEYIAVSLYARYIGTEDEDVGIDEFAFNTMGDANVVYDVPSVVNPEPALDVRLYPGGEYTGWMVMQAAEGEENVALVFSEGFFSGERFLSLDAQ